MIEEVVQFFYIQASPLRVNLANFSTFPFFSPPIGEAGGVEVQFLQHPIACSKQKMQYN